MWYLDDGTIAGPAATIAADLHSLRTALSAAGLTLNAAKCEVTFLGTPDSALRGPAVIAVRDALPNVTETQLDKLSLLGSPLTDGSIEAAGEAASAVVERLCARLRGLDSHTAVFFLAHHVSAPRLTYLLRSAPTFQAQHVLLATDETVRHTLETASNVAISPETWKQASLPVKLGGLGVRSVEALALPSYIASVHAALPLISSICSDLTDVKPTASLEKAICAFLEQTGLEKHHLPGGDLAGNQRAWDTLAATAVRDRLLNSVNQIHRARLLAASHPNTAAWIQAVPVPSLGLHLDDETIRVSVALRLGAPICEPHPCRLCARPVTSLGLHGLSCPKSAGRHSRHAHLNDVVRRSLSSAGFPAVLEPAGLDRGDGRRPDGLTVFPFREGKCLTWDVTCVDTFADTVVVQSALGPGAAARQAEERKRQRYADLSQRYIFEPVALETSGVYGPAAAAFVQELGRRISARTGERRETAWLRQRLSIAIVRGNAASVLATAPQQRRSQPRRWSPDCESESPSLQRMSGPPRCGDGTPQPSDAEPTGLPPSPHGADRSGRGNEQQHLSVNQQHQQQLPVDSQQMQPQSSPRKSGEDTKALQPYRRKAQTAAELQLTQTIRTACTDPHEKDPLYIGLPNLGNSCYQNATLQSLLGLRPFQNELMSLISRPEIDQCRTLHALTKLIALRQRARSKSIFSHLIDLRDAFSYIDPAFRGTEMQDAGEFLLRLLDTMKDEIDARRPTTDPVRNNFQYQTIERYMCVKCRQTVLKRQENISWFLSVPRRQGNVTPTLQDAIRLSMRPDRRELLCQQCQHSECRVTRKISELPRTLILQLNRYVFVGEETKKIRDNVGIPKFLYLDEYVTDDVTRPPEWKCSMPSRCTLTNCGESVQPERLSAPSPSSPAPSQPSPTTTAATAATADPIRSPSPARPSSSQVAAEAGSSSAVLMPPEKAPPPTPVVLNSQSDQKPKRTPEDEDHKIQEAITRSLKEREPTDSAPEQTHLHESCVGGDQLRCSVDLAKNNTYRLVGVVSHLGGTTHSGHYVSDVYSVERGQWFHYNDHRVNRVDEADVLSESHQSGYLFFYLHKEMCSQVV